MAISYISYNVKPWGSKFCWQNLHTPESSKIGLPTYIEIAVWNIKLNNNES